MHKQIKINMKQRDKKNYYKKIKWKTKYNELNNEFNLTKNRLEKEVETYRDKVV